MAGSFARRVPILENIVREPGESFRCFAHSYPYDVGWNYHPEHEIHLIRRSAGWVFVGDYVGTFEPGHLAFISSQTPHTWVSDNTGGGDIDGRDLVIQFSPDLLSGASRIFPELSRLTANSDLFSRSWVFDGNTAHNAAGIMEEINTAAGMARLGSFFRLVELLSASDEKVPLNVEGYVFHRDGEDKALLDEAIRYILASLPGDIRLDEVASHVRMSSSAFSRFFKHNVGRPFVDYVRTVRIARACWLLSETERPITEICFEVGYYNISNFNRSFRAERNMTPREYRGLSRLSIPSARTTSEGRALPGDRASQGH